MEKENFSGTNGNERKEISRFEGILKQKANTAVVYYCNLAFGVCVAFFAPALVEFMKGFQTNMKTMSTLMTVGTALGLVSSLGFGYIYGRVNRHAIVTLLFFIMSATFFFMPYAGNLIVYAFLAMTLSVALSCYATAQAVWIIDIWKDRAGSFIQGQHFFFALGGIIPPTLFAPFLEDAPAAANVDPEVIGNNGIAVTNSSTLARSPLEAASSRILVPAFICAGIVAFGGILLLSTLIAFRHKWRGKAMTKVPVQLETLKGTERESAHGGENEVPDDNREQIRRKKGRKIALIALSAILLGTAQAIEATALQFLPAYTHFSNYKFSQADGARVLSAFCAAYTLGRLVGIVAILKVAPKLILALNILLVFVANMILLFCSSTGTDESVWIGSVLLGIGLSTNIPTIYAFLRVHLDITNMVGGIMLFGGSAASTFYPLIIGAYIETFANIVICLNLATASVGVVTFVAIILMIRYT